VRERVALYLAAASTVAILFSIAVSQILLGAAVLALLLSRTKLRLPPVWAPLALFMAGTVISLLASGYPAAGLPQIRKFFVYLTLITVFSTVRGTARARALVLCWAAVAAASAGLALVQFARRVHEAHQAGRPLYDYYLGQRVTGFMSHWETLGGEQMIVLALVVAFLMFSPRARGRALWLAAAAAALLGAALVIGYTRGVWLGALCGLVYLVWCWRRWLLVAFPLLAALLLWANPGEVRTRVKSLFRPQGQMDSNEFRVICWRTGWRMIQAHPLLGVGPERVKPSLEAYLPADVQRPLPLGYYGHLHSVYIQYAAERGVPTLLALVAALVIMLWDYGRALRRAAAGRSDARFLLHGAVAVLVAVAVSGLFEVNLGDSEVLTLFLAVAALGYVAVEEVQRA
jgi:O-antigen ligase